MRKHHKSTDPAADRLGPLASLMRTAEPLDTLSAAERQRIKLRLPIELARSRMPRRRLCQNPLDPSRASAAGQGPPAVTRLFTVMAGVGLLLAGGVAVAGHMGLIRWPSVMRASPAGAERGDEKPRQPMRRRPSAATLAAPEDNAVAVGAEPVPVPLAPIAKAEPAPAVPYPTPDVTRVPPSSPKAQTSIRRSSVARETTKPRLVTREPSSRELSPAVLVPPAPAVTSSSFPSWAMVTPADSRYRVPKATPARAANAANTANTAPNAQDLLGQAMRSLRREHEPAAALDILARHTALFPQSPLSGERTQLEIEALLALKRNPEALLRLDAMELGRIPLGAERLVVRGELRCQARRWSEAAADFDQALTHVSVDAPWHERALWGRAMARAHGGDRLGSRADMRLYLQTYPQGRFSAEARRLTDQP